MAKKEKTGEVKPKVDSLIGKKIGGNLIIGVSDMVINGKELKKISFSDNTTAILNDTDISNQLS